MFKTELAIEEEVLLKQLLDGRSLKRNEALTSINELVSNTEKDIDNMFGVNFAKSLFEKVKNTSDYEFNEYRDILLKTEI